MIDIFERLAPGYGRTVRKFALDVWYGRADVKQFLHKALFFKRRYENELILYFQKNRWKFSPARVRELADRWLVDQNVTTRKIVLLADLKKGKISQELQTMDAETKREVMDLARGARIQTEGRVSPVVSFSKNLEARALQIGEDAAFDLGREINHDVVSANSDVYRWTSQKDKHVRPTHRMLNGKLFSYNSPPTTRDKAGHMHTGNPGTDWGCRCFEVPAHGKPLLDFTARE